MAALALQRIRKAEHSSSLDTLVFVDNTSDDRLREFEFVRDEYYPEASLFHARPHIDVPSGSWNILNALKAGYETGADRIFLIEEDVMVFPEYFAWNLRQDGDYFATCGRFRKEHQSDYYTNPGAAFKRESLRFVIPHINDNYFADQRSYLDATFGRMDSASPLDDGLIRRVIRQQNGSVLYPETPLVAHQGFHYYNKLDRYRVEGPISQRIESLRSLLKTLSPSDRYSKDFEPFLPDLEQRP